MLQECAHSLKGEQVGGPQIELNDVDDEIIELMESIVRFHISPFQSVFATIVSLQKMTTQAFGICFFRTEILDDGLIYSLFCCLNRFECVSKVIDLKQRKCSIDAACVLQVLFGTLQRSFMPHKPAASCGTLLKANRHSVLQTRESWQLSLLCDSASGFSAFHVLPFWYGIAML